MENLRLFGSVITYGGFAVAFVSVLAFIGGGFEDPDASMVGIVAAGAGFLAFMAGMFLSDAGKSGKDFRKERKAGKTTCYACGTKRRLEESCPKCGAPPSSSV